MHDEKSLRLVVLNSCEGARASHVDPFSGVASALLRCGIPAVIGMQAEITDEAAVTFSDRLYTALAQGFPIDAALAQSRRAIVAAGKDVEFGTPVLFMRVADGRIFDITGPAPPPPVGRLEADLDPEPDRTSAGGTVTWRLSMRNAGGSSLSDVTARDKAGATRAGPLTLAAGATEECTWTQEVESDFEECVTVGGKGSDGRLASVQASGRVEVEGGGGRRPPVVAGPRRRRRRARRPRPDPSRQRSPRRGRRGAAVAVAGPTDSPPSRSSSGRGVRPRCARGQRGVRRSGNGRGQRDPAPRPLDRTGRSRCPRPRRSSPGSTWVWTAPATRSSCIRAATRPTPRATSTESRSTDPSRLIPGVDAAVQGAPSVDVERPRPVRPLGRGLRARAVARAPARWVRDEGRGGDRGRRSQRRPSPYGSREAG